MSSIREGEGCKEVYPSRRELVEDLKWSPKREPSAHSPAEKEHEEYVGGEEEGEEEGKEEEEEEGKEEEGEEGEEEEEGGEEEDSGYGGM